jgi:hypothetical protein
MVEDVINHKSAAAGPLPALNCHMVRGGEGSPPFSCHSIVPGLTVRMENSILPMRKCFCKKGSEVVLNWIDPIGIEIVHAFCLSGA